MKFNQNLVIGLLCLGLFVAIVITVGSSLLTGIPLNQQKTEVTKNGENITETMNVTSGTNPGITTSENETMQTPPMVTDEPFISINPISDKNTGDLIIISGTTNLPSRTPIYLKDINDSTGEDTIIANTIACPDTSGINHWSFALDSTDSMRPGGYRYKVSTTSGDVNSSVQFMLNGQFLGPDSTLYYQDSKEATVRGTGTPYINVNPIGDRQKGDIFLVSGTTNLVEGTMLYCTVWPVYFEDTSKKLSTHSLDPCNGQYNMIGYPTTVVKGTGDTNNWSFPADMALFEENTEMIVHVSTVNEDFTEKDIYGNSTFNLT
jgi:hypothetical protein